MERLWTYRYEGAMLRYLQSWIDQLRWQRLVPFQNLAYMLLDHLDGILDYCRTKVRFGVVEAINANIKTLLRRGRGYKNLGYLLLRRPNAWPPRPNSSFYRKPPRMRVSTSSRAEPFFPRILLLDWWITEIRGRMLCAIAKCLWNGYLDRFCWPTCAVPAGAVRRREA